MSISTKKKIRNFGQVFIVLVGLLFLLTFAPALHAATYYVDATLGKDTNNGLSQTAAWKTIAKVTASKFTPGDRILFKRGEIWREQLTVPSSGSSENPITIGAYGRGALPVINGSNLLSSGWTQYGSTVWQTSVSTRPNQVFFNGVRGTPVASVAAINATSKWYWASNILYVYSTSDPATAFTSPGIEASIRTNAIYGINKSYITIDGLHLTKAKNSNFLLYNGNNYIVKNSTLDYAWMAGVETSADNAGSANFNPMFDNLNVSYNGADGFWIRKYTYGAIIQNSKIHHNEIETESLATRYNTGGGIYAGVVDVQKVTVQFNEIYNNGLSVHTTNTGVGVYYDGNNGDPATDSFTTVAKSYIRYNYIHDNRCGTVVEYASNVVVSYNIITNSSGSGTGITTGSGIALINGVDTIEVYNNTVYNNKIGLKVEGIYPAKADNMINITVKNNIFTNSSTREARIIMGGENDGVYGYNNVYLNNCLGAQYSNFIEWGNGHTYGTYAYWETLYGGSTHSVEADPKFANAARNDFHLQSSSPCINAGVDVGLTLDYDGNGKYGAAWDIGAYEWRPSSSLSPPQSLRTK